MTEFIGWPLFIISIAFGGMIGGLLGMWSMARALKKAREDNALTRNPYTKRDTQ